MKAILNKELSSEEFIEHYYLKNELIDFCKEEGLDTSGNKSDLIIRIVNYLNTSNNLNNTRINDKSSVLSDTSTKTFDKIGNNTDEVNEFFEDKIDSISYKKHNNPNKFKYNILNGVDHVYRGIKDMLKNTRTAIGKQYQYDSYIRAFFLSNPDETFENAVQCWKYKKSLKGSRKYEDSDLVALT